MSKAVLRVRLCRQGGAAGIFVSGRDPPVPVKILHSLIIKLAFVGDEPRARFPAGGHQEQREADLTQPCPEPDGKQPLPKPAPSGSPLYFTRTHPRLT